MDLGSHEFDLDDEVVLLTAEERRDPVGEKPPRFPLRRTLTFLGLAGAVLLAIVSFTASSWANPRPGLRNTSHVTANNVARLLLNEAEERSKETNSMALFDAQLLKAVFDEPSANTFFEEIQMEDGTVSYRHKNGLLVTAKKGQYVVSSPSVPGSSQFFGKTTFEDGTIALMVHGGRWLTAMPSGKIFAGGTNIAAWQTFTPKKGENGTVALRSTHGKYIGLDQTLSKGFAAGRNLLLKEDGFSRQATAAETISVITTVKASSIGSGEKFTMIRNPADDTVSFQTQYGTFLTSPMNGLVSGGSTRACGREAFTLMPKHGKVYLRTFDGWYITAHRRGFLVGDATQPGLWESFDMESNDDGTVALKSSHGKYITVAKVPDSGDWAYDVL